VRRNFFVVNRPAEFEARQADVPWTQGAVLVLEEAPARVKS